MNLQSQTEVCFAWLLANSVESGVANVSERIKSNHIAPASQGWRKTIYERVVFGNDLTLGFSVLFGWVGRAE